MFKELFGLGNQEKLIDAQVSKFAKEMARLYWKVEAKKGSVYVFGKYRNYQRDFNEMMVRFIDGGKYVQLLDTRGNLITGIPSKIESKNAVREIKNVLNVLD